MQFSLRLLALLLLSIGGVCFAQNEASTNCSPVKVTKPAPGQPGQGRNGLTVIQSIESCGKDATNPVRSNTGADLIEKSAKLALDAAADSTKATASSVQATLDIVQRLLTTAAWVLTAVFAVVSALVGLFGWKTIKDLKADVKADMNKAATEMTEKMMADEGVRFENHRSTLAQSFQNTVAKTTASSQFFTAFAIARIESLVGLLHSHTRKQMYPSAISNYRKALDNLLNVELGEVTSFINSQALRQDPWDKDTSDDKVFIKTWIYQDIAFIQKRLNQLGDAIETTKTGIAENPHAWSLAFNLACYQSRLGQREEAKTSVERCFTASSYVTAFRRWAADEIFDADGDLAFLASDTAFLAKYGIETPSGP